MNQRISDLTGYNIKHSSSIEVTKTDAYSSTIYLKPLGMNIEVAIRLGFTLFWLGFISFWTFLAAQSSWIFASFSLPFWMVGGIMAAGVVTSLFGKQQIFVRRKELVIQKILPFYKSEITIPYQELNSIELTHQTGRAFTSPSNLNQSFSHFNSRATNSVPTVIYASGNEYRFGEHLSGQDQQWLVDYLNEHIVPLMKFIR